MVRFCFPILHCKKYFSSVENVYLKKYLQDREQHKSAREESNSIVSLAGLKVNCYTESLNTDSFLRSRSSSDHEATAMMKAQFMSLWDGLDTDYNCQVSTKDDKKSNVILPSVIVH